MKKQLAFVDSLRGWAAVGVILVHCTIASHQTGWAFLAGTTGQRGVQLFYCLSAFTLSYSFSRRDDGVGNYFLRRFFRVAPLFYFAVLGNIMLGPDVKTIPEVILGMLFVDGFTPSVGRAAMGGWSISTEAIFYVLLPLLLLRVRSLRAALLLPFLAIIVAFPLSYFCFDYFHRPYWSEYFYFLWFPIEFPVFCLGITTFFLWQRLRSPNSAQAQALSAGLIVLGIFIFMASLPVADSRLYASSCSFAPLILGLSLYPWKMLVNPVMGFLGKLSFSLYLVHPFWILAADRLHMTDAGTPFALVTTFIFVSSGTIGLSILTYHWIEKPGIACGQTVVQRRRSALAIGSRASSS